MKNSIEVGIKSFEARLKRREADAVTAIKCGEYNVAMIALTDCCEYSAVIEELEFQREAMEVEMEVEDA